MRYLVNHTDRNREDRRTGETTHLVLDDRLTTTDIDAHAEQGIDEGEAVCAGLLCRLRDRYDVRNVRAQLDVYRLLRDLLHLTGDRRHVFCAGTEGHATAMYVRAGDIDLEDTDLRHLAHGLRELYVLRDTEAGDVRHERLVEVLPKLRKLLLDDLVHAWILEADGVDHTGRALSDTRKLVAVTLLNRRSLEGDGAEDIEIIEIPVFLSVAEGSGGRKNWVCQFDARKLCRDIYHTISSHVKIGPSLQTRLKPCFVFLLQPMQAPKPQPMRASKLNCPSFTLLYTAFSIGSGPQAKA